MHHCVLCVSCGFNTSVFFLVTLRIFLDFLQKLLSCFESQMATFLLNAFSFSLTNVDFLDNDDIFLNLNALLAYSKGSAKIDGLLGFRCQLRP